jgi:hypothetical protein
MYLSTLRVLLLSLVVSWLVLAHCSLDKQSDGSANSEQWALTAVVALCAAM